jgi:hypothetical protein
VASDGILPVQSFVKISQLVEKLNIVDYTNTYIHVTVFPCLPAFSGTGNMLQQGESVSCNWC